MKKQNTYQKWKNHHIWCYSHSLLESLWPFTCSKKIFVALHVSTACLFLHVTLKLFCSLWSVSWWQRQIQLKKHKANWSNTRSISRISSMIEHFRWLSDSLKIGSWKLFKTLMTVGICTLKNKRSKFSPSSQVAVDLFKTRKEKNISWYLVHTSLLFLSKRHRSLSQTL